MARPRTQRLDLVVRDQPFSFTTRALDGFPEARAFIEYLLDKGTIKPHTIVDYVTLAARLKRQGKIAHPETISHRVESTAATAYHKWRANSYATAIQPVQRAVARSLPAHNALMWTRRHALVPPYEGKTVPRKCIETLPQFRAWFEWDPCTTWTLHVPAAPAAAHQDPCEGCAVIPLDAVTLEAIAAAFEKVWGHRNLNAVPPEGLLFGEPPHDVGELLTADAKTKRVVALSEGDVSADALTAVHAKVARDVDSFLARLKEGADGVYLSREACGDRLQEVLVSLLTAWHTNGVTP